MLSVRKVRLVRAARSNKRERLLWLKKLGKGLRQSKKTQRVRNKINGTADCPRLNVFRSI